MSRTKGWRGRRDVRSTDPVPIGDVVDGLLREEVFSRGMPVAELAVAWSRIVGPRLAAETAPASLQDGVLTVSATNGPWGAQARFLNEEIRIRANEALGSEVVASVRVILRNPR